MNTILTDFAAAEQCVRQLYPQALHIQRIDHGFHNLIFLVDDLVVVRFPRSIEACKRLTLEARLLRELAGRTALQIPKVITVHTEPAFIVTAFIPGDHLKNSYIAWLSRPEQEAIGRALAQFVHDTNQAISPAHMAELQHAAHIDPRGVDQSWATYLAQVFARPQTNAELQKLIDEYYTAWQAVTKHEAADLVVHGDLHEANLLFNRHTLAGVLDFEFAGVGSVGQEFRTFLRMSDAVFEAASAHFTTLTGRAVDTEHVRIWMIATELASFCNRLNKGELTHPTYLRTQANLRAWLPVFPY